MQYLIQYKTDIAEQFKVIKQNMPLMIKGDVQAHRIEITVTNNGNAVTLGTISGKFIRPDGNTITLTGTKSGNVATVVLSADCYAISGKARLSIKDTQGSVVTTIAVADCFVA